MKANPARNPALSIRDDVMWLEGRLKEHEVAVREQIAREIEAERTEVALNSGDGFYERGILFGLARATRIARQGASCRCGHGAERHGPEAGGCIECTCIARGGVA